MRTYIFGTGITERAFRNYYNEYWDSLNILGYLDNDVNKQGTNYNSCPIYSPDILFDLDESEYDLILILSNYYYEIWSQLVNCYHVPKNKIENAYCFVKDTIKKVYGKCCEPEVREIVDYLDSHLLSVFNYNFVDKYYEMDIQVEVDEKTKFPFVIDIRTNKKIFFPKSWSCAHVKNYYISILLEQDEKSPHYYLKQGFEVNKGDIVVDVGAAEGNFSIGIVDSVSKLYIVECEGEWVEALKLTFAPYESKVQIIQAYVGNSEENVRLDALVDQQVDLIKMDIEGAELSALKSADRIISDRTKFIICTYHKKDDATQIKQFFEKRSCEICFSYGYMWFVNGMDLRKGILFAKKEGRS